MPKQPKTFRYAGHWRSAPATTLMTPAELRKQQARLARQIVEVRGQQLRQLHQ
jgi:hypothetical protein